MTQSEKLQALVEKAVEGGFLPRGDLALLTFKILGAILGDHKTKVKFSDYAGEEIWDLEKLLFNHDFAKALWGQFPTYVHSGYTRYEVGRDVKSKLDPRIPVKEAIKDESFVTGSISCESWQYHLQQAVISDNPIDYMYEQVFGK